MSTKRTRVDEWSDDESVQPDESTAATAASAASAATATPVKRVILVPNDDEERVVIAPRESVTLNRLINDMLSEDEDEDPEIPLPEIDFETLVKIVAFCKHYATDPLPEIKKPIVKSSLEINGVPAWYINFVEDNASVIFKLILAANYLDNGPLLDLCTLKLACSVLSMSCEDIRKEYNIPRAPTEDEILAVQRRNPWKDPQIAIIQAELERTQGRTTAVTR